MFRLLTIAVVFHWSVTFSMIAFMCVLAGSGGAAQALTLVGIGESLGPSAGWPLSIPLAALAAILFSVCALLFWWAFVAAIVGEEKVQAPIDILSLAFAASLVTLSAIFLYGAAQGLNRLFPTIAIHVGALLVSYVAINAESVLSMRSRQAHDTGERLALKQRARRASQIVSLARFSAKPPVSAGEGR